MLNYLTSMSKIIEYPRASLKNAIELARDLDAVGGSSSWETVAEKSGRKIGGSFQALVASAVKYGFVTSSKGRMTTTELFREHKLAYTSQDEQRALRTAFLRIPVFARLVEQFRGRALPMEIFEKVLIREYGVPESDASRISGYFLEGAQSSGLLDGNTVISETGVSTEEEPPKSSNQELSPQAEVLASPAPSAVNAPAFGPAQTFSASKDFVVRITGPGMDSQIQVSEIDDLQIVQVMLKKIAKQLSASAAGDSDSKKPSNGEPSDG